MEVVCVETEKSAIKSATSQILCTNFSSNQTQSKKHSVEIADFSVTQILREINFGKKCDGKFFKFPLHSVEMLGLFLTF